MSTVPASRPSNHRTWVPGQARSLAGTVGVEQAYPVTCLSGRHHP